MKTLKNTLPYLGLLILIYLFTSFILWELNPGKWDEGSRLVTAFAEISGMIIMFLAKHEK